MSQNKSSNEKILEKLQEIRAYFDSPEKWCKNAMARDKKGCKVLLFDDDRVTCSRCLLGEMRYSTDAYIVYCEDEKNKLFFSINDFVMNTINRLYGNSYKSIADFNDHSHTTFEMVQKVLDETIESLKDIMS
jgi:hypothetical protein